MKFKLEHQIYRSSTKTMKLATFHTWKIQYQLLTIVLNIFLIHSIYFSFRIFQSHETRVSVLILFCGTWRYNPRISVKMHVLDLNEERNYTEGLLQKSEYLKFELTLWIYLRLQTHRQAQKFENVRDRPHCVPGA